MADDDKDKDKGTDTDKGGTVSFAHLREVVKEVVKEVVGDKTTDTDADKSTDTGTAKGDAASIQAEVQAELKKIRDSEAAEAAKNTAEGRLKALEEKVTEKAPVERRKVHKLMGWGD